MEATPFESRPFERYYRGLGIQVPPLTPSPASASISASTAILRCSSTNEEEDKLCADVNDNTGIGPIIRVGREKDTCVDVDGERPLMMVRTITRGPDGEIVEISPGTTSVSGQDLAVLRERSSISKAIKKAWASVVAILNKKSWSSERTVMSPTLRTTSAITGSIDGRSGIRGCQLGTHLSCDCRTEEYKCLESWRWPADPEARVVVGCENERGVERGFGYDSGDIHSERHRAEDEFDSMYMTMGSGGRAEVHDWRLDMGFDYAFRERPNCFVWL